MKRQQRGYMLVAVLVLMLTIGAAWLMGGLHASGNQEQQNSLQTNQALITAKDALLAYAQAENNTAGSLPCPVTETGVTVSDCSSSNQAFPNSTVKIIGRVPWKKLGIEAPKNGDGDCIWMMLYMPMRNYVATTNRGDFPINPTTFSDNDSSKGIWFGGHAYPAVLVSPLQASSTQTRTWITGNACSTGNLLAYFDDTTSTTSSPLVAQTNGVLPLSMNDLLRPSLKRALEPLSLSCARSVISTYSASTNITTVRNANLDKLLLVDELDLALGGCAQLTGEGSCDEVLQNHDLSLKTFDLAAEDALISKCALEKQGTAPQLTCRALDEIQGRCSVYRSSSKSPSELEMLNPVSGQEEVAVRAWLKQGLLSANTCPTVTKIGDTSPTTPPYWLCYNGWYDLIQYDKDKQTLSVSLKTNPAYACTTQLSSGLITCK